MIFGKHINRYYLKYSPALLFGILSLVMVDYMQLVVPELYRIVVNGLNDGVVEIDGVMRTFDMALLLDEICRPLIFVILALVTGRFLWRICFFGAGLRVEVDLRRRMFARCKELSAQYYQVNKVGNLMSLFTNDLETVQDSFGWGVMMLCDALFLGILAIIKMMRMNLLLTLLSLIPLSMLLVSGMILEKYLSRKWETRQEAFSRLSDFAQENFSGIAVIKAFVKEGIELASFRRLNRENEDANVEYTKLSTLFHISVTLFVESVICVILGYGGFLVSRGIFNAGQLVEFIGYFTATVWPIMAVSEMIDMHSRAKASLKRISELLDAKTDVVDVDVTDVDALSGDIEFRGLTFRYPTAILTFFTTYPSPSIAVKTWASSVRRDRARPPSWI